ncbi:MAG: hypothetical protein D6696_18285 [Acidobacteria bacterium]|nr:MAG: hypothetical protein D6696_18285 [Acidobacteriota bacterium]
MPPNVAYDAGRAMYLAGDPERAASWFERSLGHGSTAGVARGQWEMLVGLVLARLESGDFVAARDEVERFQLAYGPALYLEILRSWIDFRAGVPEVVLSPDPEDEPIADVFRYWHLELRRAAGEDPAAVLADVELGLARTSEESQELLHLLAAELLLALDRPRAAFDAARGAFRRLWLDARRFETARAHLDLAVARYARAARAAGLEAEARAAEERYARWRAAQPAPVPVGDGPPRRAGP